MKANAEKLIRTMRNGLYRLRWPLAIGASLMVAIFSRFDLAVNFSNSLPQHVFLIDCFDKSAEKENFVAFRFPGTSRAHGNVPEGITAIKIIKGVAGDIVSHREVNGENQLLINNEVLGVIKKYSLIGHPLQAGHEGMIPASHFFVFTPHLDSLDSRYAEPGLIALSAVIGRAYPLF